MGNTSTLLKVTFAPVWLCLLFPLTIITFLTRFLISLITSRRSGGYGRLLRLSDSLLISDVEHGYSHPSIVSTFELDGDLTVAEFRKIFQNRVLQAKLRCSGKERMRYPELRQYISTILGFLIWKNEENFDLSEHIIEEKAIHGHLLDMAWVHQTLLNRGFEREKSPWEIILFRNVIPTDENNDVSEKTDLIAQRSVLAFRMHHSMGDAISIQKIFVECIGQKKQNTSKTRKEEMNSFQRIFLHLTLPLYFIREVVNFFFLSWKHNSHPWKTGSGDESRLIVKFTKPLCIDDLKTVAAEFGVTLSAVFLSLIAGGMQRFSEEVCKSGAMMSYMLSKENHPDYLANHVRGILDLLPTHGVPNSLSERLPFYDTRHRSMKRLERCVPFEAANVLGSYPMGILKKSLCCNNYTVIAVSNMAGEKDGFYIEGAWCSENRISGSGPRGSTGAGIGIFSYQNQIRITFVGKESVIPEMDVARIVNLFEAEYEDLKCQKRKGGLRNV